MLTPDEVAHGIKYGGMSEFVLIHSLELEDNKVDNNLSRARIMGSRYVVFDLHIFFPFKYYIFLYI